MHLKRWLTSIVGIPLLIALISRGGMLLFSLFIGLVMVISLWEYYCIVFSGSKNRITDPIPVFSFLMGLLMIFSAYVGAIQLMLFLVIANMIAAAVLSMPRFQSSTDILRLVANEIQGVIYIPAALSTLVLMRNEPDGAAWVFFLLFIVFAGDVGAFYAGTYLGRHKLCPSISPKKTLEGSAGGILSSLAIGYSFKYVVLPDLNPIFTIALIIVVNLAAQAGDLFESQLKRAGHIKDSGNILPGHGGLLDRIDALLFASPVIYVLKGFLIAGV